MLFVSWTEYLPRRHHWPNLHLGQNSESSFGNNGKLAVGHHWPNTHPDRIVGSLGNKGKELKGITDQICSWDRYSDRSFGNKASNRLSNIVIDDVGLQIYNL